MATKKKVAKRAKTSATKQSSTKRKVRAAKSASPSAKRAKISGKKKVAAKSKTKRKATPSKAKKSTGAKKAKASIGAKRKTKVKASPKASKKTTKKATVKRTGTVKTGSGSRGRLKGQAVRKKSSRNSTSKPAAKVDDYEPPPPIPKTRLTDKQLAEFKQTLLIKRRVLTGDVRNLTIDALNRDTSGDLSTMPIHMADIGSDNWEQEFTLGLIESEQQLVREIDDALQRIEDRIYGVCLATNKPITVARLRAKPWAKYCIEYARQNEKGRR